MLLRLKQRLSLSWLDGHRYRATILIALFTFLLAMPAVMNGKPFLFFDSSQYFAVGKVISTKVSNVLSGHGAEVAPEDLPGTVVPGTDRPIETDARTDQADGGGLTSIAGGRSPVYSLLVYVLGSSLSLFSVVALQSLITAWVLFRFLEMTIGQGHSLSKLGLVAGLAVFTPLGFHVGFIMPDIFAGLFVVSALTLMFDRHLSRLNSLGLVALLAVSATMHTTIIPLGAVLVVLVLLIRMLPEKGRLVPISAAGWIGVSLFAAILLQTGYGIAVEKITGDKLSNPPYLMARVLADGTGERFLEERCSDSEYTVCKFKGIKFVDHNDFLWGGSGAKINFSTSDKNTRDELKEEQLAFVTDVVLSYPIQQFLASLSNTMQLISLVGISETSYGAERILQDPSFGITEILDHEPGISACRNASKVCQFDNPVRESWGAIVRYSTLIFMLSLVVWTAWELYFARNSSDKDTNAMLAFLSAAFLIVLVTNAAVCGTLSAPHDRYQARLAWICALVLASGLLRLNGMSSQNRDAAA